MKRFKQIVIAFFALILLTGLVIIALWIVDLARSNSDEDAAVGQLTEPDTENPIYDTLIDNMLTTYSGDGDLGNIESSVDESRFALPFGLTFDRSGNLIVFDTFNASVKRISNGKTITVSGFSGTVDDYGFVMPDYLDGAAADALFGRPVDGVTAPNGDLFIIDSVNHAIRIKRDGSIYTFSGGVQGHSDGSRETAMFNNPTAIAIDSAGNLFIADTFNHVIRSISTTGEVETIAGKPGVSGYSDGIGSSALFNDPSGISVDSDGIVYVADAGNQVIRKIYNGNVTTIAGIADPPGDGEDYRPGGYEDGQAGSARFDSPHGLFWYEGVLFIADTGNHTVRALLGNGNVLTVAGSGSPGDADGLPGTGMMNTPTGIVCRNGYLYIADTLNNKIKIVQIDVKDGEISTVSAVITGTAFSAGTDSVQSRSFVVEKVTGNDSHLTKGTARQFNLRRGTRLARGNTANTGRDTTVDIKLDDNSSVIMNESTKLNVSKVSRKDLMLTVVNGSIAVNAGEQQSDSSTTIVAGNTTMGIRGTLFTVNYSTNGIRIVMLEGTLETEAPDGVFILEAGQIFEYPKISSEVAWYKEMEQTEGLEAGIFELEVGKIPDSFTLEYIKEHAKLLLELGIITEEEARKLDDLIEQRKAEEAAAWEKTKAARPDTGGRLINFLPEESIPVMEDDAGTGSNSDDGNPAAAPESTPSQTLSPDTSPEPSPVASPEPSPTPSPASTPTPTPTPEFFPVLDPVITITTQPAANVNMTPNDSGFSLSVRASVVPDAELSYQWFNNTSASNTGGTPIFWATTASFNVVASFDPGEYYYYVEVSAPGAETVRSSVATVTVQ